MVNNHFFHLVDYSPWPLVISLNFINLGLSIFLMLFKMNLNFLYFSIILMILILFQWWRDIIREGLFLGCHSLMVKRGLSLGVLMFIVSEFFFFISFFWMFFYVSLSPSIELGMMWPPIGYEFVNFLDIPLMNTLILLSSGFFITWAHINLFMKKNSFFLIYGICLMLGSYILVIQIYEYYMLSYSFTDGVFGCAFFILTGFHGFHVIVGLIFLMINFIRFCFLNFSYGVSFGFDYAVWYWHFVDVVWLFLYLFIYWWGM